MARKGQRINTGGDLWAGGAWDHLPRPPIRRNILWKNHTFGWSFPVDQWTCIGGPPSRGWENRKLFPRTLSTKVRQHGSACGLFPWSLAGTFPFGGPFTDGPFTAGAAALAGAADSIAAGAAAPAAGVALAAVTALPGFGTPIPWGAAGACPPSAAPPIPPCGTAAGAGLAPSEHPAKPLAAPARASTVTAHHTHLTGIEKTLQMVDLMNCSPPAGPRTTFREARPCRNWTAASARPMPSTNLTHRLTHTTSRASPGHQNPITRAGGSRPQIRTGCQPRKQRQSIDVLSDWPSARPASWRSVSGSVSTARYFTEPSTIE